MGQRNKRYPITRSTNILFSQASKEFFIEKMERRFCGKIGKSEEEVMWEIKILLEVDENLTEGYFWLTLGNLKDVSC